MLTVTKGDLFTAPETTLVITVNTVGAMGRGIALTFKERYPEYYRIYHNDCKNGKFDIGQVMLLEGIDDKRYLLVPTKKHFKYRTELHYLEASLTALVDYVSRFEIADIALPPLGCGYGGRNFDREVYPLLMKYLHPLAIPCRVYL